MLEAGKIKHGSVAVTFDDGYRDNLLTAVPILKRARIPATFFISGDGASESGSFWWERLDASFQLMEGDDDGFKTLHRRLMFANLEERGRILRDLPSRGDPLPAPLNHDDLRVLASEPLAEIGAHGWSHRSIAELPIEDQRREVIENLRLLGDVTENPIRSFAYPFGGPVTAELTDLLRESGISKAYTVDAAPVTVACDPFRIPRMEVRDWEEDEFELKLRALLER
jgi:peptidoglycan/xylan/chitin deacetylase (PgdA/CDA1 family)